jgi:hypothetical protein
MIVGANRFAVESLEPRILLSADLLPNVSPLPEGARDDPAGVVEVRLADDFLEVAGSKALSAGSSDLFSGLDGEWLAASEAEPPPDREGRSSIGLLSKTSVAGDDLFVDLVGADRIRILTSADGKDLLIQSADATPTFDPITVTAPPSGKVVIRAGDGDDTFLFESVPPAFSGKLKFDGGGGTNTVQARLNVDYELSDTELRVGTEQIQLTSISSADLTAGAGSQTFTISNWLGKSARLGGGEGSDAYCFGTKWGNAVLVDPDGGAIKFLNSFNGSLTFQAPSASELDIQGQESGAVTGTVKFDPSFDFAVAGADLDRAELSATLGALAGLFGRLGQVGKLDQPLFILNDQSIGDVSDLGGSFRTLAAAVGDAASLPELLRAWQTVPGVTATGSRSPSGVVAIDVLLNSTSIVDADLNLGDDMGKFVQTDHLRGDMAVGLQWHFALTEAAGHSFTATSLSHVAVSANLERNGFDGWAGLLGLHFGSPSTVYLDADVVVGTSSITSLSAAGIGALDAGSLAQAGTALAKVDLRGQTTVRDVALALASDTQNISLTGGSPGNTIDLFIPDAPRVFTRAFDAAVSDFYLLSAGELFAHMTGFADFLGMFSAKGLGMGLPLSASGKTFADVLDLDHEFRENFLALITRQALNSGTLVSGFSSGAGVRTTAGADLRVTLGNGSTFTVDLNSSSAETDLGGAVTVGDLIGRLNAAASGAGLSSAQFEARIDGRTGAVALVDRTVGTGSLKVEALNGSRAAYDLDLLSAWNRWFDEKTLVRDLNGGLGARTVAGPDFRVRIGTTTFDVDLNASADLGSLDAATTLGELVSRIKAAAPASITSSDWEVTLERTESTAGNYRYWLRITDKTGSPAAPATVTAIATNIVSDLQINGPGSVRTAAIVAQNIGFQGSAFRSIQELISLANAGSECSVGTLAYASEGVPTLTFTTTISLGADVGDTLTESSIALFDSGPLTGLVTTTGSATLNPEGTLTLPFEIQLTTLGAGFTLTTNSPLSQLNGGRGVETVAGNDMRVHLSNGTSFDVDLNADPSSIALVSLGLTTKSGNDIVVTLRDKSVFGVDLDASGAPTTVSQLAAALNAAYAALNPAATSFEAKAHKARGSLVLVDRSAGSGEFTVTAPTELGLKAAARAMLDGSVQFFAEAPLIDLGDLMQAIQSAATVAGAPFKVEIADSGRGLLLTDGSNGAGEFTVESLNDSFARVSLGLCPAGEAPAVSATTPVSSLTWTGEIGTVSGEDIQVTLQDGSWFDVDLDSATGGTVADLLATIQTAADTEFGPGQTKFKTGTPAGSEQLALIDYTTGANSFSVADVGGSTAAAKLGLTAGSKAGVDSGSSSIRYIILSSSIRLIEGNALDDDTSTAHIGWRGGTLSSSVALAASGISATGLWGPVEVAVSGGTAAGTITFNMGFADPGSDKTDGLATLRELRTGLVDVSGLIVAVDGFTGIPSGPLALTLPLGVAPEMVGLMDAVIATVSSANVFGTAAPTVALEAGTTANVTRSFLEDVSDLTMGQVLAVLDQSAGYLQEVQASQSEISRPIAGLNRSLGQLLPFGDEYNQLLDALKGAPPRSLQTLATALSALGFTGVNVGYEGTSAAEALTVGLTYSTTRTSTQRFSLTLAALDLPVGTLGSLGLDTVGSIVDTNESSLMTVSTAGSIRLDLGVDLASASHMGFLSDSSSMSFGLGVPERDLNFDALIGACSVTIKAGTYVLDIDGSGSSTAPATFAVAMLPGAGRHTFEQSLAATTATFAGQTEAVLPIVYPQELNEPGTSTLHLVIDSNPPPATTTLSVTGPNVKATLATMRLNGNLQGLRAGFKELFRLLDFAFDAAVFSRELPFVGKQLVDSADFLTQIRDKVSDNFKFVTGILTPEKARQALFDAFGPGGLNWLQDRNRDQAVNLEDISYSNITDNGDDGVLFDLGLTMPSQLLEIPVQLDMILPGLGLVVNVSPEVRFGFSMNLKFGISVFKGVFVDASSIDGLTINLDVSLPAPTKPGDTARDLPAGFDGFLGTLPYRISERASRSTGLHGTYRFALSDLDGRLNVSELMSAFGSSVSPLSASARTLASNMILGGFSGTAEAHLQLQTDLPVGTALPTYRTNLDISNWSFSAAISGASTSFAEVTPIIAFDGTQFELVSFVRDFMGAALTRLETAMNPLDVIVYMLTNEAWPIISLVFGRAPYTSARSFGGGVEIGDYAGAAEAISRMVTGENRSGSNIDAGRGGRGAGSKAWLVGAPGNLLDSWAPVSWELLYGSNFGWTSKSFGGMPEALQYVGALTSLTGTAWIEIGDKEKTDFTIDGAAARTSGPFSRRETFTPSPLAPRTCQRISTLTPSSRRSGS